MRQELAKNERILAGCMDRVGYPYFKTFFLTNILQSKSTSQGLKNACRIAKQLGLSGFHGPMYELFEVDEIYAPSVEVVAGNR